MFHLFDIIFVGLLSLIILYAKKFSVPKETDSIQLTSEEQEQVKKAIRIKEQTYDALAKKMDKGNI